MIPTDQQIRAALGEVSEEQITAIHKLLFHCGSLEAALQAVESLEQAEDHHNKAA